MVLISAGGGRSSAGVAACASQAAAEGNARAGVSDWGPVKSALRTMDSDTEAGDERDVGDFGFSPFPDCPVDRAATKNESRMLPQASTEADVAARRSAPVVVLADVVLALPTSEDDLPSLPSMS